MTRRRSERRKPRLNSRAYGLPVPAALHEAIENERGNLARAESVLGCLAISMEHEADASERPYYPDVASLARELVKQSINRLDSLILERRLRGQRVEEMSVLGGGGAYRSPRALAFICVGGEGPSSLVHQQK
jgi:hypothetical protein